MLSALRAVLEIVQVPSHAVSAAEAGLSESLGHMLKNINNQKGLQKDVDEEMLILTMQVLHALQKTCKFYMFGRNMRILHVAWGSAGRIGECCPREHPRKSTFLLCFIT